MATVGLVNGQLDNRDPKVPQVRSLKDLSDYILNYTKRTGEADPENLKEAVFLGQRLLQFQEQLAKMAEPDYAPVKDGQPLTAEEINKSINNTIEWCERFLPRYVSKAKESALVNSRELASVLFTGFKINLDELKRADDAKLAEIKAREVAEDQEEAAPEQEGLKLKIAESTVEEPNWGDEPASSVTRAATAEPEKAAAQVKPATQEDLQLKASEPVVLEPDWGDEPEKPAIAPPVEPAKPEGLQLKAPEPVVLEPDWGDEAATPKVAPIAATPTASTAISSEPATPKVPESPKVIELKSRFEKLTVDIKELEKEKGSELPADFPTTTPKGNVANLAEKFGGQRQVGKPILVQKEQNANGAKIAPKVEAESPKTEPPSSKPGG